MLSYWFNAVSLNRLRGGNLNSFFGLGKIAPIVAGMSAANKAESGSNVNFLVCPALLKQVYILLCAWPCR